MDTYPNTFAFVQIHRGDAYETAWANTRWTFYGAGGYPTSYFDGVIERVGAWPYLTYRNDYLTRSGIATDVTITLSASPVSGQTYTVQVITCLEAGGAPKTVRLYMVQVLDHWPPSPTYFQRTCWVRSSCTTLQVRRLSQHRRPSRAREWS